jgi:hypothetical protein
MLSYSGIWDLNQVLTMCLPNDTLIFFSLLQEYKVHLLPIYTISHGVGCS